MPHSSLGASKRLDLDLDLSLGGGPGFCLGPCPGSGCGDLQGQGQGGFGLGVFGQAVEVTCQEVVAAADSRHHATARQAVSLLRPVAGDKEDAEFASADQDIGDFVSKGTCGF